MRRLVSVVMPVYNAERFVGESLNSLLKQTYENLEIIVVDDGSTDESANVVSSVAAADSRVNLLVSHENQGVAGATNLGISQASSEFIVKMDADDICMPTRVEEQVAFLAANQNVVAVGSRALYVDEDGDPLRPMLEVFSHEEIYDALLTGNLGMINPTVTLRRDAVLAVGGYRDSAAEDLDLWLRLADTGKLANLSSVLLKYRVHSNSISYRKAYEQVVAAQRSIADAITRSGLGCSVPQLVVTQEEIALAQKRNHERWAWWALSGGNVRTARKHVRRALVCNPLSLDVWKLLVCTARGY